jgi:hypothetical protein
MSKQAKSSKSSKEGHCIEMNEINSHLETINYRKTENLEFESKYFLVSMMILLSMNILINKSNLQNYNFKLMFLTVLYLSRRVISKLWYYFQIKEIIISRFNYWMYMIGILLLLCNSLYLIFDLLATYKLYNILSLFYP